MVSKVFQWVSNMFFFLNKLNLCNSIFVTKKLHVMLSLSCRTRESLASNTSSIVESNRRQNPALSPGHIGTSSIGLPFSFRTIPEPPTTQPEKLQKSSNCLASITSVWQAAQTETITVVEERGKWGASPVFFHPRFPQPTHTHKHSHAYIFRLLRIHLLGLL